MDISKIVALQKDFDENHGWSHNSSSTYEKIDFINKDIIGLVGEIGEFSNIIKKLNLLNNLSLAEELNEKFIELHPDLQEELVDAFIYLIRISVFCKRKVQRFATRNAECCHPIYLQFF